MLSKLIFTGILGCTLLISGCKTNESGGNYAVSGNIKNAENYDSITITQLYEHEDFSEKEALWKPLSLKKLKYNIEKAQNNIRLDLI